MEKPIEVKVLNQAKIFLANTEADIQVEFLKAFSILEAGHKVKSFKKMKGTNGLWEFSQNAHGKFYRLFAFWDSSNKTKTLVVCTSGIEKKKNKTPLNAILTAEAIKEQYFS